MLTFPVVRKLISVSEGQPPAGSKVG